MKKFALLFSIALILLAVGCAPVKQPVTAFKDYEVKNVNLTGADVVFNFNIDNPNDFPIKIKDISYSIDIDGSNLLRGVHDGFNMSAKETVPVSLPLSLEYAKLAGQAANLAGKFLTNNGTMHYAINGELTVADTFGFSTSVPINAKGEMKIF